MLAEFVQIVSAAIVGIPNFILAYQIVWPSYTLPLFKGDGSPLNGTLTESQANLIGSLGMLGSLLVTPVAGMLGDYIGRKRGQIISGLIATLSCALLCTTSNINVLLATRFFNGVAGGLFCPIYTLHLSEIAQVSLRGTVMSIGLFEYCGGILCSYVLGWLCSYNMVNYFALSLSVFYVVAMCGIKETPMYLLKNGKEKEALESLKFYRATRKTTQKVLDEFAEIKNMLRGPYEMTCTSENDAYQIDDPEKEKLRQESEETTREEKKANAFKTLMSSPSSRRALLTVCILIFFLVFSGLIVIQAYAGMLFKLAVPDLSPDMCSIALAVANIVGSGLPILLNEMLGRRVLMISSSVLMTVCLTALGALLKWRVGPPLCIPVLVLAYCFCFQLGVGCVPFVLVFECFLPEVKTLCITIALCCTFVANFIMLYSFDPVVQLVGVDGLFLLLAVISAVTAVTSFFILPETSGLTTEEIQKLFGGYLQFRRKRPLNRTVVG